VRRLLDSCSVSALALLVYLGLGQRTFYGVDGWMLVRRVAAGDVRSDMHLLYKPIAAAAARAGAALGLSVYESMLLASAVGTAVGVGLIHAAARELGAARREALWIAALAGALPGVVFYATVVERHGPFFAFAGLTAWASAALARRPGAATATGFALACTLAYAAHSTGVLMVAAYLPLVAAWMRTGIAGPVRGWGLVLWSCSTAAIGTALGMFVARRIGIWAGTVEREGDNFAFFLQHAAVHVRQPDALPLCLWQEIVVGFAPLSLLWLLAFRDPRPRLVALALSAAVLVYLLFSFLILGAFDERGAYALPLAWPFAWVAVRRFGGWLRPAALGLALALAALFVVRHDDRHLDAWAEGMFALAGERQPYLLAAAWADFELIFLHQPGAVAGTDYYDAFDAHGFPAEVLRDNAALLLAFLRARHAAGRELLLTDPGLEALRAPAEPGRAGALLVEVLESGFVFEPVDRQAFRGHRLVPRP
jgi:hypothetical protein